MKLAVRPLTPELWPALEDLFGKGGASNGLTPRAALLWLDRRLALARVDDEPVWSISCFTPGAYTGFASTFARAGFERVDEERPIMRRVLPRSRSGGRRRVP